MNQWIKPLAILLGVQLLLLALLSLGGGSGETAGNALLDVQPAAIAQLQIADNEDNEVVLERGESGWALASALPVDESKVDTLLEKLTSASAGFPVASSAAAVERFEVAEDNFQRRVTVGGEDLDERTFYFGTSPGYQQVHSRFSGDEIYAVKLSNFEMPAKADEWLDKGLLGADGDVDSVAFGAVALQRDGDGWLVNGQPATEEAANAVRRVAQLRVLGAGGEATGDGLEILVQDAGGEHRLALYGDADDSEYVVTSSRFPERRFRVAKYVAEQLEPELADLLPPPEQPAAPPTEPAAAPAAPPVIAEPDDAATGTVQ